jgi:hypothetical protein
MQKIQKTRKKTQKMQKTQKIQMSQIQKIQKIIKMLQIQKNTEEFIANYTENTSKFANSKEDTKKDVTGEAN